MLELLDNTLDYVSTKKTVAAEEIFEDFFKQLFLKNKYSINDLLLISYYAIQCQNKDYEEGIIQALEVKVLEQEISGDEYYNVELLGTVMAIAGVYLDHAEYFPIKKLADRMHVIIEATQQYSLKPLVLVYEAKYYLHVEQNVDKAKECYEWALLLARNFGDSILEANIRMEREKDSI